MKPCSHPVVLPCHPAIRFKHKSERSVLLLPLYASLQGFVARSALVPLQPVVIPETVLSVDSLLLCHHKQIVIQPAHASFPVLLFWARVHPVHHQLVSHKSFFTLTNPWNWARLVKIFPGIIVRQHHTDRKLMGLLREQCAELRKGHLRYCCNQVWMKNGGLVPWNTIPIFETFKIS